MLDVVAFTNATHRLESYIFLESKPLSIDQIDREQLPSPVLHTYSKVYTDPQRTVTQALPTRYSNRPDHLRY